MYRRGNTCSTKVLKLDFAIWTILALKMGKQRLVYLGLMNWFSSFFHIFAIELIYYRPQIKIGRSRPQPIRESMLGDMNTQTQEETQNVSIQTTDIEDQCRIKRSGDIKDGRPVKKLKMSVALGVDLAE